MSHDANAKVLLGIALPVFNGEQYLEETILSLLEQTMPNFRLVLSDNASTDRTQDICKAYAAKDNRIKYIRNKENMGIYANSAQAFQQCGPSKYVCELGHDDLWLPTFAEKLTSLLEDNSKAVMAFCKCMHIDGNGAAIEMDWMKNYEVFELLASLDRKIRLLAKPVYMLEHAVVRSDIYKTDYFTKRYGIHEDVFTNRALIVQGPCLLFPEILFRKRIHSKNFSSHADYKNSNAKIDCLTATRELNNRFNFSVFEFLCCWSSLFRHYKLERPMRKIQYGIKKTVSIIIKRIAMSGKLCNRH